MSTRSRLQRLTLSTLIVGCALSIATPFASAQTIHVVMAGDTRDAGIGPGAERNIARLGTLFVEIGSLPGWKSNIKRLVGEDFTCDGILSAYNAISPGADDLVVLYYAGHGSRLAGQHSQFPRLNCQLNIAGTPLLEDLAMAPWSRPKTPRMVIAIADACNVEIGKEPGVATAAADKVKRQAALIKLFAKPSQTLIMSGSDMGQYSFYYPSGGIFSKKLVDALEEEFEKGSSASWDSVIAKSTIPEQIAYQGRYHIQRPIALSTLR